MPCAAALRSGLRTETFFVPALRMRVMTSGVSSVLRGRVSPVRSLAGFDRNRPMISRLSVSRKIPSSASSGASPGMTSMFMAELTMSLVSAPGLAVSLVFWIIVLRAPCIVVK